MCATMATRTRKASHTKSHARTENHAHGKPRTRKAMHRKPRARKASHTESLAHEKPCTHGKPRARKASRAESLAAALKAMRATMATHEKPRARKPRARKTMHTESLAHTERRATQMGGSPYLIAYGRLFRSTQRAWKASSCACASAIISCRPAPFILSRNSSYTSSIGRVPLAKSL